MAAVTMGRLTKVKVDKIRQLFEQGYTKKEIAEKLDVSRGTVAKYVEEQPPKREGVGEAQVQQLLHELVNAFSALLVDLNVLPYIDLDYIAEAADSVALKLMERIATINPTYAKSLMQENPYIKHLANGILDLSKPDEELDEEARKQRHVWVSMMKKFYPEKLAEFV